MSDLRRLSDAMAGHLIAPRHGPGVCIDCLNLTAGYERCFACTTVERHLDVMVPVSYSVAGAQLCAALAAYKRDADPFVSRATAELAAVLWRFLELHERCVAAAAGTDRFDVVTTVPSSDPARDAHHPIRRIVGELVGPTRDRHVRLMRRTAVEVPHRQFDARRFVAVRPLDGRRVLVIDDTWTTGASANSAGAALRAAGAARVAAVVIGRQLSHDWHDNLRRLHGLRGSFDFTACALCAGTDSPPVKPDEGPLPRAPAQLLPIDRAHGRGFGHDLSEDRV